MKLKLIHIYNNIDIFKYIYDIYIKHNYNINTINFYGALNIHV